MTKTSGFAALLLALGACASAGGPDDLGEATVEIRLAATAIPLDGQCVSVTATSLSNFQVTHFRGLLAGATLKTPQGDHRVTAVAYPQPCNPEPVSPPWAADDQITTFNAGNNVLVLNFKKKVDVGIDANFEEDQLLSEVPGSRRRISHNFEDITDSGVAGKIRAIDGWEVKLVDEPQAGGGGAPGEVVAFSTQVVGATPYSPRGMAQVADGIGSHYFQVSEVLEPIARFDSTGNFVGSLPVIYPAGTVQWNFTDGLDGMDLTHLVRTGWLNVPTDCNGEECQAGLDILELKTDGGFERFEVVDQIFFTAAQAPLNVEYPLVVRAFGGNFALVSLPGGPDSTLTLLDGNGAILAGPTTIAGSNEGLALANDGRLMAMTYNGVLTAYDPATLAPRAGETLSYVIQPNIGNVASLAWDAAGQQFVALELDRLTTFLVNADFTAATPTGVDLSGYITVSAIEVRNGQLAVIDRIPPGGVPRVDHYNFDGSPGADGNLSLTGGPAPSRPRTIAAIGSTNQIALHYRRPNIGGVVATDLDTLVWVHNGDGSLAYSFDVAPLGFNFIFSIDYLAGSNELLLKVQDLNGGIRLLVTDLGGGPRRSYNVDLLPDGFGDPAPISTGAYAGQIGNVINQPTHYFRINPI